MGLVKAFSGAVSSTLADQWLDIVTADFFDEYSVVVPGQLKETNNGRGSNQHGSDGVLSNGSKILVPENTAAFIFSQGGIEEIITDPGGYTYTNGQTSVFDQTHDSSVFGKIAGETKRRFAFGGETADEKRVAFVNLREIRGIKFGTRGPLIYNDSFYGTDLSIQGYGNFSIQVVDPITFIRNFVPANTSFYSFQDPTARAQVLSEFLQSFMVALNALSTQYRISELPAEANLIAREITSESDNAGTWLNRFGFVLRAIAIENIDFSAESKELVKQFSAKKMNLKAYEDVSQHAADIAAQQNISEGVKSHGLGDAAGLAFGMNMVQGMNPTNANTQSGTEMRENTQSALSITEQIETVKKLQELLDAGILTQEEFDAKKKETLGL